MIPAELEASRQELETALAMDETDDAVLADKQEKCWQWAKSFGRALYDEIAAQKNEAKRLREEVLKWERKYGTFKEAPEEKPA